MHYSCHAQKRMKQRGIRRGQAEFVLDPGRAEQVPGGAERLVILRKELHQWIAFHLDEARRLMRMRMARPQTSIARYMSNRKARP